MVCAHERMISWIESRLGYYAMSRSLVSNFNRKNPQEAISKHRLIDLNAIKALASDIKIYSRL
jgi:hypothetical protein